MFHLIMDVPEFFLKKEILRKSVILKKDNYIIANWYESSTSQTFEVTFKASNLIFFSIHTSYCFSTVNLLRPRLRQTFAI